MRLMRNVMPNGQCKYALVRMDNLQQMDAAQRSVAETALEVLHQLGILENPKPGDKEEFLVIKLKDRFSPYAFNEYARAVWLHDEEFARDVYELSRRAGESSPWCRHPDTTVPAAGATAS